MRSRLFATALTVALAATAYSLHAQSAGTATALSGLVSSDRENKMEGVLVTVRGEGHNRTVTVVSDAEGRYSFPRTHIEPGKYAVTIRATGYDLPATTANVTASKTAAVDLRLSPAKDLPSQLTSLEWAMSFPGTQEEKDKFVYQAKSCNYCHDYKRIVNSKHTAEQFKAVVHRMNSYYPDGTAVSNDGRGWGQKLLKFGDSFGKMTPNGPMEGGGERWGGWPIADIAVYLEKINLSGGKQTWAYEPKASLPRPTGKATRVIITQWDQPRKVTTSHDMSVDSKGNVWYGDEAHQVVGMLNPATNEFKEYELPATSPGNLSGVRDVQVDADDNVFFPLRVDGGASLLTKLDPKTGKTTPVEGAVGQFTALGPGNKIWMGGAGSEFTRIDARTNKLEASYPGRGYQVVVNSKGNPYIGGGVGVVGYDVAANKPLAYPLPTKGGFARRGKMDPQDRFWFGEYYGDKIGVFDTKAETFKEWSLRKYSTPYTASQPDKRGHVWAPSNMSDRIFRLDPATGEIVEYLMPSEIDVKEIEFSPTSRGVSALMSNMRAARIIRVEPLD